MTVNRSKYPRRPQLDDRIEIAVTTEMKRKAYEMAATKGKPAAEFIREAIAHSIEAVAE